MNKAEKASLLGELKVHDWGHQIPRMGKKGRHHPGVRRVSACGCPLKFGSMQSLKPRRSSFWASMGQKPGGRVSRHSDLHHSLVEPLKIAHLKDMVCVRLCGG